MGKLTQAHIKAAIGKPGRHHDGDGLVLFVRESGQASWVARIQHNGTRREIGLGSLRAVGLGEAREKASTVKAALVAGRDPHLALKPPKEMTRTFREAALGFLEAKTADAKISDAKRKQNLSQLKTYAFPALGKLQVQSIDADAIAACLRPIWTRKPETARKVRSLIIRTLRFARPDGALFIGTLGPAVADRLPAQPKRGNFEAMPYAELPAFMSRLADRRSTAKMAIALVSVSGTDVIFARSANEISGNARAAGWLDGNAAKALLSSLADRNTNAM